MSISVDCAMMTVELATLLDPVSREELCMASQALSKASGTAYNSQTEENLYTQNLMSGFECEATKEVVPQEPLNNKTQDPKCYTIDTTFTKDAKDSKCQKMQVQEEHDMNNSVQVSPSESLLQETESSEQPESVEIDAQMPSSDPLPEN